MTQCLDTVASLGRKRAIDPETHEAIARAVKIFACDRKAAAYAAAPHEGITPEDVAAIRRKLIAQGRLTKKHYSMRGR